MMHDDLRKTRPFQLGQATAEYLLLGSLVAIAMFLGRPSPVERLVSALQSAYLSFSIALSLP